MTGNTHLVRRSIIACCSISFVYLLNTSCMLGKDFERALGEAVGAAVRRAIAEQVMIPMFMSFEGAYGSYELWLADGQWKPGEAPHAPRHRMLDGTMPRDGCQGTEWRLAAIEILYPTEHGHSPDRTIFRMRTEPPDCTVIPSLGSADAIAAETPARPLSRGHGQRRYDIYWKHVTENSVPHSHLVNRVHVQWPTIETAEAYQPVLKEITVTAFEPQPLSEAQWQDIMRRAEAQSTQEQARCRKDPR